MLSWSEPRSAGFYQGHPDHDTFWRFSILENGINDGPANRPGDHYAMITYASLKSYATIMLLWPEFRAVVNTDRPIEWVHRCLNHGYWTIPDPVARIHPHDRTDGIYSCDPFTGSGCGYYQATWGPDPDRVGVFAIEDPAMPTRWGSRHGVAVGSNGTYEVSRAESHIEALLLTYEGPTYREWFTPLGECVPPEIIIAEESGSSKFWAHTSTPAAEIRYTLDGSEPTKASALYSGAVELSGGETIRARAYKAGETPSKVSGVGSLEDTGRSVRTTTILGGAF